jgi:hypothetical protein
VAEKPEIGLFTGGAWSEFIDIFIGYQTVGYLAQRDYGWFVAIFRDQWVCTQRKLTGAFAGKHNQIITIAHVIHAIFDGQSGHYLFLGS